MRAAPAHPPESLGITRPELDTSTKSCVSVDEKEEVPNLPLQSLMSIDTKIRIGVLLLSFGIAALAALAAAHGLHLGVLDGNGTGPHT